MNSQALMILLAQEELPSFWRLLAPVLTLLAIVVFGWINEKAKRKLQQQQQEEEKARRSQSSQAPARRGVRRPEEIHRYQPQIPAPGHPVPPPAEVAEEPEPELILVAEDVSAEAAREQLRRQQLRAEAVRRERASQAQRQRAAAIQAKQVAVQEAQEQQKRQELARQISRRLEVPGGLGQVMPDLTGEVSPGQLGRAVVWAEILGPPRALRPAEQLF